MIQIILDITSVDTYLYLNFKIQGSNILLKMDREIQTRVAQDLEKLSN